MRRYPVSTRVTRSRMTMPTAANQWNWKFQRRVSCLANKTDSAALPIFLALSELFMRPRNNLPPKNHWTGPQRGLKLVNNEAARFAIAAFPALRFPDSWRHSSK